MEERLESVKIATTLAPWDKNENAIWLASTVTLLRNVEKFKFPPKMEPERKKQLLALLTQALLSLPGLQTPRALKAEELSPLEKNFLLEHFLIFEGISEAQTGQAFVLDDSGRFLALLNFKDHLRLHFLDIAGDLEKTWGELIQVENALGASLNFAFSEKFGFLVSAPTLSGTALVVTAFLHLPTLIHTNTLSEFLEKEKSDTAIYTGLQGNPEDLIGDILTVRNAYTIGVNEETIFSNLRSAILKLVVAEKSARSQIKDGGSPHLKDKISRALGVVKFSYQLETVEALAALSLLKLGVELGLVKGINVAEVNFLFFTCRHAHLAIQLKEVSSTEDMAIKRAQILREKFKDVTCDLLQKAAT